MDDKVPKRTPHVEETHSEHDAMVRRFPLGSITKDVHYNQARAQHGKASRDRHERVYYTKTVVVSIVTPVGFVPSQENTRRVGFIVGADGDVYCRWGSEGIISNADELLVIIHFSF